LAAGAIYSVNRWLTFGLAAGGVLIFLGCAVWQLLVKEQQTP